MKQENKISNWDAKRAFSNYIDLRFTTPPIYIDEYWDYYIDEYNKTDAWETFLTNFQNDKLTLESFVEEYNRITSEVSKIIATIPPKDVNIKCEEVLKTSKDNNQLPYIEKYFLPDGEYLQVDVHDAFDEVLKYLGVFNPNYKNINEIVSSVTKYKAFHDQKGLNMQMYYIFRKKYLFQITNNILIEQVYQSKNPKLKEFTKTLELAGKMHGDSYLYKLNGCPVPPEIFDEYECGNIKYHIEILESKTINMFNHTYKCLIYKNKNREIEEVILSNDSKKIFPYLYPFVYKLITNQELNEKDLTIGYDDQIFFQFDKSEIYGTDE